MLTIQTWGGLGDVLREISLLPVDLIFQQLGMRTRIRHLPPGTGKFRADAGCPASTQIAELVSRIPACHWAGEGPSPRYGKPVVRILRGGLELFPFGRRLFSPDFQWKPEDILPGEFHPRERNLVVQTHLAGLPSKRWSTARWRGVLGAIRRKSPDLHIHVLDPAGTGLAMDGVTVHDKLSVPQAIRLVAAADLLFSVDSWSKYVAAWHRIPQLILVPEQTSDYPELTAATVWKYSFRGLHESPEIRLLGLRPEPVPEYILGTMESFPEEAVLKIALEMTEDE